MRMRVGWKWDFLNPSLQGRLQRFPHIPLVGVRQPDHSLPLGIPDDDGVVREGDLLLTSCWNHLPSPVDKRNNLATIRKLLLKCNKHKIIKIMESLSPSPWIQVIHQIIIIPTLALISGITPVCSYVTSVWPLLKTVVSLPSGNLVCQVWELW